MLTYNVLAVTPYEVFNWAFSAVIVWFPVLFLTKALVRTLTRT
jgi:hypothetical protein